MYALFHFLGENSAGVGNVNLIKNYTEAKCKIGDKVLVKWGKKTTRYLATIIEFGANEQALSNSCEKLIKKLSTKSKRASSPSPDNASAVATVGKKQRTEEDKILEKVQKSLAPIETNPNDDELASLRAKVLDQEGKIKSLQAVIAAMSGLPELVSRMEAVSQSKIQGTLLTSHRSPGRQTDAPGVATGVEDASPNSKINIDKVKRCSQDTAAKYTNEILQTMYTNEYMATHSMSGMNSAKPAIPKEDWNEIVSEVISKFPTETRKTVSGMITGMLCNAAKTEKKRATKRISSEVEVLKSDVNEDEQEASI